MYRDAKVWSLTKSKGSEAFRNPRVFVYDAADIIQVAVSLSAHNVIRIKLGADAIRLVRGVGRRHCQKIIRNPSPFLFSGFSGLRNARHARVRILEARIKTGVSLNHGMRYSPKFVRGFADGSASKRW